MRTPNKVNTKPFERFWKWKRKENIFDFKGRRRKGENVLYLSVRRREIEAKKVPFYREKGHQIKALKVTLLAKEREGARQTIYFYHQQNVKAEWESVPFGIHQNQKDRKRAMKWLFFAYSLLHINKICVFKPSVVPNRKEPPSFSFKRFLSSLAVSGKLRTATLACVKSANLVFSSFLLRLETACILNFLPCQFSMKWGETKR
jgi:hypothetical protein